MATGKQGSKSSDVGKRPTSPTGVPQTPGVYPKGTAPAPDGTWAHGGTDGQHSASGSKGNGD